MTPNETATLIPYLQNVTWTDDNETLHHESSVLPQQHVLHVTRSSLSISTTVAAIIADNVASTSLIDWLSSGRLQIPLYATILLLAIVGNALVIMTLVQNRRMRTITNVFLLNLAVSDILLGVFCMPFTLVGTLLRDFVFGELMCKFIPYLQGKRIHYYYYYYYHQNIVVSIIFT